MRKTERQIGEMPIEERKKYADQMYDVYKNDLDVYIEQKNVDTDTFEAYFGEILWFIFDDEKYRQLYIKMLRYVESKESGMYIGDYFRHIVKVLETGE